MQEKHFSHSDILNLEQRFRAAFINSITGFKSLCLIGTKDNVGQTNLAVFSSLVHLGSHPPYFGFIVRPDSVDRHTLENILNTKYYTINHVNERFYQKAHQTAARYPKTISEFEAVGLNEAYLDDFFAPYVEESTIKVGAEFRERVDIALNQTILIIGEIQHVYFPEIAIASDGFLDLEKAGTITCNGLDSYHKTQKIARLSYAKPDKAPQIIH
jgi:flavin reductase (DIM6/NTAB) family NADH-FMN oxidoreductase RutF